MSKQIFIFLLAAIFQLTSPYVVLPCSQHSIIKKYILSPRMILKITSSAHLANGQNHVTDIRNSESRPIVEDWNFAQERPRPRAKGRYLPVEKPTTEIIPIIEDKRTVAIEQITEESNPLKVNNNTETNNITDFDLITIVSKISNTASITSNTADKINAGPFAAALLKQISALNQNKNVIVSPFSLQTALTLLYMGAEGDTEEDLRTGLRYPSSDKLQLAENISQILNSKSSGLVQLTIANKIYTGYELDTKFNKIAKKYFKSEAETVDFSDSKNTVNAINSWVEEQTNNKITDLLSPTSVDKDTTAILVNAIYFKAQWADQFSRRATSMKPFWLTASESVDVSTMFGEISCRYGEFPQYDATAIELKYEDEDMALLIVLPNQREGLRELEAALSSVDLTKLSDKMNVDDVEVRLPKFKIEFDISLVPVLEELGMKKAFSSGANYTGLFKSSAPVKVSDVVQKAYIEVNEYGSEAAAATYVKTTFLSSVSNPKIFTADHPFLFAIKNNDAIYFAGHVVKF